MEEHVDTKNMEESLKENMTMDYDPDNSSRKRTREVSTISEDSSDNYDSKLINQDSGSKMAKKKQEKKTTKVQKTTIEYSSNSNRDNEVTETKKFDNLTFESQDKDKNNNLYGKLDRGPYVIFLRQNKIEENNKVKSALDIAEGCF